MSFRDTIASKKWDQCLFLALALLDSATAETVLTQAIETDLSLAVSAVRYAEEDQSASVARLLRKVLSLARGNKLGFDTWLWPLPVGPEHVELLRDLLPFGGSVAAEAVLLIARVLGSRAKPELFALLEVHADDYNFAVNGIAKALGPLMEDFVEKVGG